MVFKESNEYVKDKTAVSEFKVKIFGIPVYRSIETSTNSAIVAQLTKNKSIKKITGFSDETYN